MFCSAPGFAWNLDQESFLGREIQKWQKFWKILTPGGHFGDSKVIFRRFLGSRKANDLGSLIFMKICMLMQITTQIMEIVTIMLFHHQGWWQCCFLLFFESRQKSVSSRRFRAKTKSALSLPKNVRRNLFENGWEAVRILYQTVFEWTFGDT